MKVYVVTSGEYSDYHIDGVFDDLNRAEIYAATIEDKYGDHVQIEEFDTEECHIESSKEVKKQWHFAISEKKNVCYCSFAYTFRNVNTINFCTDRRHHVYMTLKKDVSEEKAKKIAFDRLAEYEAKKHLVC